jgi:hypothetical protein
MLLQIGSKYTFDVFPATIIGNGFKNVEVVAIMNATTASQYADLLSKHEAVRPYLPAGTPTDPLSYTYVRIINSVGAYEVLAYEWINAATIAEILNARLSIVISNTSPNDITRLRDILINSGYTDIEITTL